VEERKWRWIKSLKRRSQRAFMSWEKFTSTTDRFFPSIRILLAVPLDAKVRHDTYRSSYFTVLAAMKPACV
jgi:hypothetical protein